MDEAFVTSPLGEAIAGLDRLAETEVAQLSDAVLREQVLALLTMVDRSQAELGRRIDTFDQRGLCVQDGFRTTKAWLQGFGRLSGSLAQRMIKVARLLRRLPELASAANTGEVSQEHVRQVTTLADQVGPDRVREVEPILTDAAKRLDLPRFAMVCQRVRAHVDPDGHDPAEEFARREVTISPVAGMVTIRGQLDPEGGAALATALNALMPPPGQGEQRSAGQRRADALVQLARQSLSSGAMPTVGGQRPQVGVLVYPQALSPAVRAKLIAAQRRHAVGWDQLVGWDPPPEAPAFDSGPSAGRQRGGACHQSHPDHGMAAKTALEKPSVTASWSRPGWADPPWLDWVGPIPPEVAQRVACDADVFRIILDPANGMPLDVGRAHRLVPYWIRRALWARDRGCRWIGCTAPVEWTDAHHLTPWADGGETSVERCVLLCRHHHGLVHEGGWSIDLDSHTGNVAISRPGGAPYLTGDSRADAWTGPTTTGSRQRSDPRVTNSLCHELASGSVAPESLEDHTCK